MTVRTCDKCGLEINTNPMVNAILPMFYIRRIRNFAMGWQSVDLCPGCEKKLEEWLNNVENMPRKKGRWIKSTKSLWPLGTCSECGYISVEAEKASFCPSCGAEMREEE